MLHMCGFDKFKDDHGVAFPSKLTKKVFVQTQFAGFEEGETIETVGLPALASSSIMMTCHFVLDLLLTMSLSRL